MINYIELTLNKVSNQWKVSAILDWEFAFSGSMLWDVANMLRYAHQVPANFEKAFISGLVQSGITLPKDWKNPFIF